MTARRLGLLAAAAALVLAGLAANGLFRPHQPGGPAAGRPTVGGAVDPPDGVVAAARTAPAAAAGPSAESPLPRRPASLRGTRPDGALERDAAGRFRVTFATRLLLDYWLSTAGEEPLETTRARIVTQIERRLPAEDVSRAVALLDRYLAYRERARALDEAGGDATSLEKRLDALVALRRDVFGAADAEALFGDEEANDRAALARRRALEDTTLSDAERAAALARVDAALPEAARQARDQALLPLALRDAERDLRAGGGSDADVQALRDATVGPEAARRLAALDRENAAWDDRVAGYREARAAIVADAALSAEARAAALDALRAARFPTPPERHRIEALDRIAGLDP